MKEVLLADVILVSGTKQNLSKIVVRHVTTMRFAASFKTTKI